MIVLRTLSLLALALLVIVGSARSQSLGVNSASSESEEDILAREVDDPTAILTQLKLQDLYTRGISRRPHRPTRFSCGQLYRLRRSRSSHSSNSFGRLSKSRL